MLLTPQERRALLTLISLLVLGQLVSIWREHRREQPDRELSAWLTQMEAVRADTVSAARDDPVTADGDSVGPADSTGANDLAGLRPGPRVKPAEAAPAGLLAGGKIRINAASAQDLEMLPGIGPALAKRILAERTSLGEFRGPDDLLRVKGIGPKTLQRLVDYLDFASR